MNSSGDNISGGDIFSLFLNSDIINLLFFSFLKSVLLNVIKYWQPNFDDSYTTFMSDCFKWLKVEYKKVQKANDISFLIQLVILSLEFEGVLNEMEKKAAGIESSKKEGKENKKQESKQEQITTNTLKPTETGIYAEAW